MVEIPKLIRFENSDEKWFSTIFNTIVGGNMSGIPVLQPPDQPRQRPLQSRRPKSKDGRGSEEAKKICRI